MFHICKKKMLRKIISTFQIWSWFRQKIQFAIRVPRTWLLPLGETSLIQVIFPGSIQETVILSPRLVRTGIYVVLLATVQSTTTTANKSAVSIYCIGVYRSDFLEFRGIRNLCLSTLLPWNSTEFSTVQFCRISYNSAEFCVFSNTEFRIRSLWQP
jgi:hypothetical protein